MTARALHLRRERRDGEGLDLRASICGWDNVLAPNIEFAASAVEVTCSRCARLIRKMAASESAAVVEVYGVEAPARRGRSLLSLHDHRAIKRSMRGEENERPRFITIRSALQQYFRVVDDGAPVASSSNPDRFGRAIGDVGGAVKNDGGRDDMIDVEMSIEAACRPIYVGREVSAHEARRILEMKITGKRVWSPTMGRKAGTWRRVPQTYEAIAESLGDGWTKRHVTLVVRHVTREMTEDLVARGVLEARELRRGGRTEAAEMRIPGYDLESWKEIAAHLQTSVSTAQRRRSARGLPVRTSSTGYVYARRADLDAWSARQVEQATKESA